MSRIIDALTLLGIGLGAGWITSDIPDTIKWAIVGIWGSVDLVMIVYS